MENVILTPHIAGMTQEVRKRVMDSVVENTLCVLRGETPSNMVNPSAKSSTP
jgi:phosphoglycerate dehydrogenase-like enzyme